MSQGVAVPTSTLGLQVIRKDPGLGRELTLKEILANGTAQRGLSKEVNAWRNENYKHLKRGLVKVLGARKLRIPHFYGQVWHRIIRADGEIVDLGLASMRVVTTAGVNAIVDSFQNTFELENFKFHGIGTGSVAEASTDTALGSELTTQYNPDSTRATGTLAEGSSSNIFKTVATNTVDAVAAVTEHGIFSQAAAPGGTLLDRSVFSAVNLASGDSLQTTYELTVNAGG